MSLTGVVGYRGPSVLDGEPVVALLTPSSNNAKTGNMAQVWILRADVHPFQAVRTKADASICGSCRHRGDARSARTCYVTVQHGPAAIYRALQRGHYTEDPGWSSLPSDMAIRLGAYGDPAAVPPGVWQTLLPHARTWTAYTHLWRTCDLAYRDFCMASVDTAHERVLARVAGWRTFRVRTALEPVEPGEIVCPASNEAGHRTTCLSCRLCMGQAKPAKDIAIVAHGSMTARFYRGRHQLTFL